MTPRPRRAPNISPRAQRIATIIGASMLLAAVGAYAFLIVQTVVDPASRVDMNAPGIFASSWRGRNNSQFGSWVGAIIVFGALSAGLIGIADTARRRIAPMRFDEVAESHRIVLITPPVRPLTTPWTTGWLVVALGLIALVFSIMRIYGLAGPDSSIHSNDQRALFLLLLAPAFIGGGFVGMLAISLFRKLDAVRQQRVRELRGVRLDLLKATPAPFLSKYRGDSVLGATGGVIGAAAGWAGLEGTENAHYAFVVFLVIAAAHVVAGTLATRQFWRTGRPINSSDPGAPLPD